MSQITTDQLAGMMQNEFSKIHEGFSISNGKIDNLATDTKEGFSIADKKINNLTSTVEWIATELKTLKQELTFNQSAHDRYETRILALEKDINLVKAQLK